jgi:hypothetical protein
MTNQITKHTIVLTMADSESICTFAITKGIVSDLILGGINSAQVLRKANAILTGTTEEIVAECERAFNSYNSNGSESEEYFPYYAHEISTFEAEIVEAGNGLPYTGDLVYSGETNTVYRIAKCSRVQVNGNGKGNSVDVILIEAGDPDDYSEESFADILECRVDLNNEDPEFDEAE